MKDGESPFLLSVVTGAGKQLVPVLVCDAPVHLFRAQQSKETAHFQNKKARLAATCST